MAALSAVSTFMSTLTAPTQDLQEGRSKTTRAVVVFHSMDIGFSLSMVQWHSKHLFFLLKNHLFSTSIATRIRTPNNESLLPARRDEWTFWERGYYKMEGNVDKYTHMDSYLIFGRPYLFWNIFLMLKKIAAMVWFVFKNPHDFVWLLIVVEHDFMFLPYLC